MKSSEIYLTQFELSAAVISTTKPFEAEVNEAITGQTYEEPTNSSKLKVTQASTQHEIAKHFRLINEKGGPVGPKETGLLLYNGGTVCNDGFSDDSANAICREMGYSGSTKWDSGGPHYEAFKNYTRVFDITLDEVRCNNNDWSSCSYLTSHNCGHSEDVFLACTSGTNRFSI